ncbi:hypothetical protein HDE_13619 [Halotydeus destructor]|nr:hypothetical protein HDE_13619 [Halotydeus destructor]
MFSSAVLCLIVLTTVSSEPVKPTVAGEATLKGREFFWFGPTVKATFPEAQQLCSLYDAEIAEPLHVVRQKLQEIFTPTYWINGYYDVETSMWRWISDDLPINYITTSWDTDQPGCQGDDCATWRPIIVMAEGMKFATVDERSGTKLPVICEKVYREID